MSKQNKNSEEKALALISESGVINPKMTLEELIEISSKLESFGVAETQAWTFVTGGYVYKGDQIR